MLNTTSSFVSVHSELYTLLLFCFRPMLLSLCLCVCVIQRMFVRVLCTLSFCFSLHLHICVCLLVSEEESFLTILFVFVFCMFLNKYSLQQFELLGKFICLFLCVCYIFYCVVCLRVGKTGYYCLLDSMELLLSLWLNKTKAQPFVSFHRQKTTSRLELIKETLCMRVCEWEMCECV